MVPTLNVTPCRNVRRLELIPDHLNVLRIDRNRAKNNHYDDWSIRKRAGFDSERFIRAHFDHKED
jgi:hypothetical protein